MEVEARVSVQAMRGRFEQLHDDSPLASCTPKINTSPIRTRSKSAIVCNTPRSEDCKGTQGKLGTPVILDEKDKKSASGVKCVPVKETKKSGSYLFGIVSSGSSSSKCDAETTPRKQSVDKTSGQRERTDAQHRHGLLNNCKGEKTDANGADPKPSVVRRIPVFKSIDAGLISEGKKPNKDGEQVSSEDSHGRRSRLFGHIRSRSHGNFIIKRDSSVEKHNHSAEKNEGVRKQRDNVINKDWLAQRRKQKSSDNLLDNQDSKSNSTFEGKQKIVANVVKNMNNKEKPKVLRKLSFSSKIEKELKNMKEKAVSPSSRDKQVGCQLSSPDIVNKVNKMQAKHHENSRESTAETTCRSVTDDNEISPNVRKTSPVSGAAVVTVAIAKAVADVALKKSGTLTVDTDDSPSSPFSEDTTPPSRPPRRRSPGYGLLPHKKGKAPSPPGQPSVSPVCDTTPHENDVHNDTADSTNVSGIDVNEETRMSPDDTASRHSESPDLYQSSESLLSSQSQEKSRESSPVMINQSSFPIPCKRTIIGTSSFCRKLNESNDNANEENETFRSELNSVSLGTNKDIILQQEKETERNYRALSKSMGSIDECRNDSVSEATKKPETECLPPGPPPRKPPRTFAYDIYKNVKVSEDETNHDQNETGETKNSSPQQINHPLPVYAVPLKKKKNSNKFIPMPPVRSKSDLTKKDIPKPTVAPKPAHILTKVKRASVVDPLSCAEKDEEAAIQRQAHIRYSLRKPNKPPPTPPPYQEVQGNSDSSSECHTNLSSEINNKNQHEDACDSKKYNFPQSSLQGSNDNDINSLKPSDLRKRSNSTSFPRGKCTNAGTNDCEDVQSPIPTPRVTSHSAYNLQASTPSLEDDQPLSLGYCSVGPPTFETALHTKRSMSDETLYKGSRHGDEPVYATPIFPGRKGLSDHNRDRELHYMCSVLFTDEEDADAGRDGMECGQRNRRNSTQGKEKMMGLDSSDGSRGRSSLISSWKREFRQSCRQVQNKIKKTVIR